MRSATSRDPVRVTARPGRSGERNGQASRSDPPRRVRHRGRRVQRGYRNAHRRPRRPQAPAASAGAEHRPSEAPSAAAVACDTFTILNHRTDLDQSGDWKKLYVDPFQAKYPGIKTITTESITRLPQHREDAAEHDRLRRRPGDPQRRDRERVPELLRAARHRRRPQDEVPLHRGDRQLRGQGLRHRHQRQRQRHPVQQEGLRGGRHHRLAEDARRVHRRPPGDQGQGPGRRPAVHELRGRLADVPVAAVHGHLGRRSRLLGQGGARRVAVGSRARASTSPTSCCTTWSRRA